MAVLTPGQLFDAIAIRVNGPKAWDEHLSIGVVLDDEGASTSYRLNLHNGVLVHRTAPVDGADLTIHTSRAALPGLLTGKTDGMTVTGDTTVLTRLMAVLEAPDPDFAIVTP
jgi:alkyl sulfatase BDS1-like metallo-beta-lactamase superfamily hydrolase